MITTAETIILSIMLTGFFTGFFTMVSCLDLKRKEGEKYFVMTKGKQIVIYIGSTIFALGIVALIIEDIFS
jgi:hypothetical protein